VGISYLGFSRKLTRDRVAVSQAQEAERRETLQLLTASMVYDFGEDPANSVFTFSNGGKQNIILTSIETDPGSVIFGGSAAFQGQLILKFRTKVIESGGDGQSEPFLRNFFSTGESFVKFGRDVPLTCGDLTLKIKYTLASQPSEQQDKKFRFVTRPGKNGLKWLREDLQEQKDFCADDMRRIENYVPKGSE